MISGDICAFCRHWMAGTTDGYTRVLTAERGDKCICHVKQPLETSGNETCPQFASIYDAQKEAGA